MSFLCFLFVSLYYPRSLYIQFLGIVSRIAGHDTLDGSDLMHIHQAETLPGSLFDTGTHWTISVRCIGGTRV